MEGGGGGLGSVVSVITSAASNWVSRHTAPLSVPSHRLHVLQRSLSLCSPPPSPPPLPSLLFVPSPVFAARGSLPLAHPHVARSLTRLPAPRASWHLLMPSSVETFRAIPEAARWRSDLGSEARPVRKRASLAASARNSSCPLLSPPREMR